MWIQHSHGQDITFEATTTIWTQEVACNIENALKVLFLTTELRKTGAAVGVLPLVWKDQVDRGKNKLTGKYYGEGDNPDPGG